MIAYTVFCLNRTPEKKEKTLFLRQDQYVLNSTRYRVQTKHKPREITGYPKVTAIDIQTTKERPSTAHIILYYVL